MYRHLQLTVVVCLSLATALTAHDVVAESIPSGKFTFGGVAAPRIDANVRRWLLEAPLSNPGIIEMFRVRDREPVPQLVPWAGEFIGKYLISAVQALRMTNDPRLEPFVAAIVADLISTQAEDGYLGPFRKQERLLGHWDLWGHYHVMMGLLMWHERTGDVRALEASRKAADLVCKTYLSTGKRVVDAGSPEMNMAIITSLGWLYRITHEPRYKAMMEEVLADFEREGDYFRAALAGTEFYRTPRPRWESLHCIQGLVELYRITGDERYKTAFLQHWKSIKDWDLRNTGGFSSGEQATGNPYEDTAIETCCTIAWMALSVDALRLTGDPQIADVLELSFYNGVLGAQHPSGRWWTYNTPMNGVREASAHTIVFQSRAGTPELNCCSVNAPRGLGMLSEWGVMLEKDTILLEYLGPLKAAFTLPDGTPVEIETTTNYPLDGDVRIKVKAPKGKLVQLKVRVPGWAHGAMAKLPGEARYSTVTEGYLRSNHAWQEGDEISLKLPLSLRSVSGDMEQSGKVSLYRGPILLAYDQPFNAFDPDKIPSIDLQGIGDAEIELIHSDNRGESITEKPWLIATLGSGANKLRLCDYASAGANGTHYRSWLGAKDVPPPAPMLFAPKNQSRIPPGPFAFTWRKSPSPLTLSYIFTIAEDSSLARTVFQAKGIKSGRYILLPEQSAKLEPGMTYFWNITASDGHHSVSSEMSPSFAVDPSLKPLGPMELTEFGERDDGAIVDAPLTGTAEPRYGVLAKADAVYASTEDHSRPAVELKGASSNLAFKIRKFPDAEYSYFIWLKLDRLPDHLGQVISAWARGGDDPLRLCVDQGKLFARIEGSGAFSTPGVSLPLHRWVPIGVVKERGKLRLYVDGKLSGSTDVAPRVLSSSRLIAIGRNPLHTGDESLPGRFTGFRFYARALTPEEIASLSKEQ